MKRGNLSKVIEINTELDSIQNKTNEIKNLEEKLQSNEFQSTTTLKVEFTQSIITVKSTFTCSDLLLICQHRKTELSKRKEQLFEELEKL